MFWDGGQEASLEVGVNCLEEGAEGRLESGSDYANIYMLDRHQKTNQLVLVQCQTQHPCCVHIYGTQRCCPFWLLVAITNCIKVEQRLIKRMLAYSLTFS